MRNKSLFLWYSFTFNVVITHEIITFQDICIDRIPKYFTSIKVNTILSSHKHASISRASLITEKDRKEPERTKKEGKDQKGPERTPKRTEKKQYSTEKNHISVKLHSTRSYVVINISVRPKKFRKKIPG